MNPIPTMNNRSHGRAMFTALTTLILSAGFFSASTATAQDVLDANLQVGSGGYNAPAVTPDYRLRNLLITGNVAGGRGFRGSVGYGSDTDFRGSLGSEELFSFRAASAYSDLTYVLSAPTASPLITGQNFGLLEARRASSGTTINRLNDVGLRLPDLTIVENTLDRALATMSDLSGVTRESAPLAIGELRDREGNALRVSASTLRGVQVDALATDVTAIGLSLYDGARLMQDAVAGRLHAPVGAPFRIDPDTLFRDFDEETPRIPGLSTPTDPLAQRRAASLPEGYEGVLSGVRDRLRQLGVNPDDPRSPGQRVTDELSITQRWLASGALPDAVPTDPLAAGADDPSGTHAEQLPPGVRPDRPEERNITLRAELLRHGVQVDQLAGTGDSRFVEVMADGESQLRQGEFFFAERRFTRALRLQPNHPLATAGLANAQVGAGLYLAAAYTLRELYMRHPEMIDVRYHAALLPDRTRMERMIESLSERLHVDRGGGHAALVLAFLGKQTGDEAAIRRGLEALRRANEGDLLVTLLEAVWLGERHGEALPPAEQREAPAVPPANDADVEK